MNQDFSTIGAIEEKLSPMDAVRAHCTQCLGMTRWNEKEVEDCQGDQAACGPCPLHPYRMGKRPTMKTFRKFCLDCVKGDNSWINECPSITCSVYPYRFGHNPALIGIGREAPKEGIEALRRYRERRRVDAKNNRESIFLPPDDTTPMFKKIESVLLIKSMSQEGRLCHE